MAMGENAPFRISLSIEKDKFAHSTLELRCFYRQFEKKQVPKAYYQYLRGQITKEELFNMYPREARKAKEESWNATLGEIPEDEVDERIYEATKETLDWLLIGGPPCQAYSYAGRSRILGEDKKRKTNKYENDSRHYLYREYLRILAEHTPPVFVMENVKGILSSRIGEEKIFDRILADLKSPTKAVQRSRRPLYRTVRNAEYEIFSLVKGNKGQRLIRGSDYLIKSEEYGIPQTRHRVFLLGIRNDLKIIPECLQKKAKKTIYEAISDLPPLRSRLSREPDSYKAWREIFNAIPKEHWFKEIEKDLQEIMLKDIDSLKELSSGGRFVGRDSVKKEIKMEKRWLFDPKLHGYNNHESRSHIGEDLKRYFYAACFAKVENRSPLIPDFPKALHPAHQNIDRKANGEIDFEDRFRVQLFDQASTTIVSHISKDGHYFIHPDSLQCRSLTVREAARIQTFPDNYFFEGPRTEQYKQVGNAVPPLLARQIGGIVYDVFNKIDEMLDF